MPNFFLRPKLDASIPDIFAALGRSRDALAGGKEEVTKEDNNLSVAAFPLVSRAAGKLDVRAGCVCGERCAGPRTQQTLPRLEQNTGGHFVIRLVSIVESASEDGRCNISRSNLIW